MKRDGSGSEMARIQKGLEDFLQQELQGTQEKREFREFQELEELDLDEPDEIEEAEEFDCYDYQEDWDSREYRERNVRRNTASNVRTDRRQSQSAGKSTQKRTIIDDGAEEIRPMAPKTGRKKKKKRRSKFKRFLITVTVFLALLLGGMYYVVGTVYDRMEYQAIEDLTKVPMQEDGVVNILLIGNDSRSNGEDGRSDAMILLSVSKKTKKIYMTSLLRDMYVEIPGHDNNRLNAAYSFGGAKLLMETIEKNFDITLNRYVLVNFEAFANVVDAVGGIDLELTAEEVEYVNAYLWEYNVLTERPEGTDYMDTSVSGMVHLNGAQALSYSRNRYIGNDFGRTERQRKVLEAIIKKAPKALVTNPEELIQGLVTNLTTNLTQQECFQLCFKAAGAVGYDIEQSSIPLDGTYSNATIRGMSVLEVDFEANKDFIQENIYGEKE